MFKKYQRQLQVPLFIYADFEAITEKVHRCKPNNDKPYTDSSKTHSSYGYKVVCCYDNKFTKPVQT